MPAKKASPASPSLVWIGALLGALSALTVIAVLSLGERLFGFPFVPFDIFDWMARILPGGLISFVIQIMVTIISALNLGDTSTVAKLGEQTIAILQLIARLQPIAHLVLVLIGDRDRSGEPALAAVLQSVTVLLLFARPQLLLSLIAVLQLIAGRHLGLHFRRDGNLVCVAITSLGALLRRIAVAGLLLLLTRGRGADDHRIRDGSGGGLEYGHRADSVGREHFPVFEALGDQPPMIGPVTSAPVGERPAPPRGGIASSSGLHGVTPYLLTFDWTT